MEAVAAATRAGAGPSAEAEAERCARTGVADEGRAGECAGSATRACVAERVRSGWLGAAARTGEWAVGTKELRGVPFPLRRSPVGRNGTPSFTKRSPVANHPCLLAMGRSPGDPMDLGHAVFGNLAEGTALLDTGHKALCSVSNPSRR
eukprot:COSAG02_NODE_1465_length_12485_cov_9.526804_16_plen_148_part_00